MAERPFHRSPHGGAPALSTQETHLDVQAPGLGGAAEGGAAVNPIGCLGGWKNPWILYG